MKNPIFAFVPPYLGKGKSHFIINILSYHLVENIVNIYDKRKLDFSWRMQMNNIKKTGVARITLQPLVSIFKKKN